MTAVLDPEQAAPAAETATALRDHRLGFWDVVADLCAGAEQLLASAEAAKAVLPGGRAFHEEMVRLSASVQALDLHARRFDVLRDEYERGVHR